MRPPRVCFKARLSSKPLIWKWLFILKRIKLIFIRKVLHFTSLKSESFGNSKMTKRVDKQNKQICTCSTLFGYCTTTTWNCLISSLSRTTTNDDEFHSLSLNLNIFFRNSTLGEFGCIRQSERVRIIKVKSQRTWSHILSDVLAAVAVAVCKAWSSKVKQAQNKHKSKHTTNKSIKWGENWTLDLAGLNVVFQPPKVSAGKTLRLCFEFYLNVMLRLHCIFQLLLYKYRRRGTLERSVFPPFSTPVFKTLTLTA